MNTNQTRQIRSLAVASAIVAMVTMFASPAMAEHPHTDDSPGRISGPAPVGYATPLASLDGRTLAQYLEQHEQQDGRTFTAV